MEKHKFQLMQTDPPDELRHDQSLIASCYPPKLDAECDQQITAVVERCQQRTTDCRLFIALAIALGNGRRAVTKFSKSILWEKVPQESNLIFEDSQFFYRAV